MKLLKLIYSLLIISLTCISCSVQPSSDLAIVNLTTNQISYPKYLERRQVVVQINDSTSTYSTLVYDNKTLQLKTLNLQSNVLAQETLPLFQEGYASTWQYAISPDSTKMIHRNNYSTDLFVMDLKTGEDKAIWEDAVTKYGQDIKKIVWLSNEKFLIMLGFYPDNERNEITIVNINNQERRKIYVPIDPDINGATLSNDKRLFTFIDSKNKTFGPKIIKILNLETEKVEAKIGYGSSFLGSLSWNTDETELAYIDEGHEIKIWSSSDDSIRTLFKSDPDFLLYKVVYLPGQMGYVGDYQDAKLPAFNGSGHKLTILDATSGKQIKQISEMFTGNIYYLKDSNTIVAEIGY